MLGIHLVPNRLVVFLVDLILDLVLTDGATRSVAVVFNSITCLNLGLGTIVLCFLCLGILNYLLHILLGETTLLVSDSNLVLLTGKLVLCIDIQDTVDPSASTMASTSALGILQSRSTFSTGFKVPRNRSMQSSSNLARVIEE